MTRSEVVAAFSQTKAIPYRWRIECDAWLGDRSGHAVNLAPSVWPALEATLLGYKPKVLRVICVSRRERSRLDQRMRDSFPLKRQASSEWPDAGKRTGYRRPNGHIGNNRNARPRGMMSRHLRWKICRASARVGLEKKFLAFIARLIDLPEQKKVPPRTNS